MRRLVAALGLALGGCWNGPVAFAPADDAGIVAPGKYLVREVGHAPAPGEPDDPLVLRRNPAGGVTLRDGQRTVTFLTVPVGPALPGRYFVQGQVGDSAEYGLLDARGGRLLLAIPACDEATRVRVRASGGSVYTDPNSPATCSWRDRAAMLAALRDWAGTDPRAEMELVRSGGR